MAKKYIGLFKNSSEGYTQKMDQELLDTIKILKNRIEELEDHIDFFCMDEENKKAFEAKVVEFKALKERVMKPDRIV